MADGAENNSCCFIARRIADVVVSAGWGEVCFCARVRRGAALDSRSPPSPPAALGPWKSRGCRPVQSAVQCSVAMDETPGGCPQGRTVDGRWSLIVESRASHECFAIYVQVPTRVCRPEPRSLEADGDRCGRRPSVGQW